MNEAGRNTSTLVGGATTKTTLLRTVNVSSLQTSLKRSTESESSSDSNSSATSTLSKSVDARNKKKHKSARLPPEPTKGHLAIRAVVDAGGQWELDLEKVHGLTDEEACVVVAMANKYSSCDAFPPCLKGNPTYIKLAKKGWEHLKELYRVLNLHLQCGNQTKIDGVWKMLREGH